MQFMTALFGGNAGTLLNAIFALGIVLVLIVLAAWLLKMFGRAGEGISRGGREKRLVVVETAAVDGKRKVLLIRRDGVEHLIMTGGPSDVVIESGIAAPPEAPQMRRRMDPRPAPSPAAAAQAKPADIETPITPDRPVGRDTVDRLRDLTRPAPLKPRVALRHTALLRPVSPETGGVIPMTPELRVDNSASPSADSARGGPSDDTGGQVGLGGRNRFFRRVARDRS